MPRTLSCSPDDRKHVFAFCDVAHADRRYVSVLLLRGGPYPFGYAREVKPTRELLRASRVVPRFTRRQEGASQEPRHIRIRAVPAVRRLAALKASGADPRPVLQLLDDVRRAVVHRELSSAARGRGRGKFYTSDFFENLLLFNTFRRFLENPRDCRGGRAAKIVDAAAEPARTRLAARTTRRAGYSRSPPRAIRAARGDARRTLPGRDPRERLDSDKYPPIRAGST